MTKEEKIAILKDIIDGEIVHPQVRRDVGIWAIKALEQEPIPTMVYPQVEGITPTVVCEVTTSQEPSGETVSLEVFKQVMWERDIAIEQLKVLGYEFGQKIEPSGDAISRQAVLDITWEEPSYTDALNVLTEVRDKVESLPSVNPQPKTGHCTACKHYTSGEYDGSCDSYICEHYSGWESDNCN